MVSSEQAVVRAVEQALPSVVTVSIGKDVTTQSSLRYDPSNPAGPFVIEPGEEQHIEGNIGSGFIVSESGLIITNKHVVSDTEASYTVILNDGSSHEVVSIQRDPLNDLALVKIKTNKPLTPMPLADSNSIKLGQMAIAIGTPLGEFRNTVTTGIVSGLGRGITAGSALEGFVERLDNVIQTDAAINPGNSGGPLLNSNGEVMGVNTAISQSGQNIGFAIPVSVVKELLENYESSGGTISRPFLGVEYQIIDREMAITERVPSGAYVLKVVAGSSASDAGIQEGDIITDINGKRISKDADLAQSIKGKKVGDTIALVWWRDGETIKLNVTLGAYQ
ncbi:MAG: trypsin-like peptidase domain-containing protein, partial [Candidatus Roizmanbacteria bacterium]|nr:trypsin-like peptidase domain-containing protein [Candidatus Roizmanbacteria bacterium]